MAVAIWQCHFRIAEISFFALDYKFTTKLISNGKLFDVPRYANMECDGTVFLAETPHYKERDPNKLGTRNTSPNRTSRGLK
jgi:hypothetical protein